MIKINLHPRAKDPTRKRALVWTAVFLVLLAGTLSQAREAFINDGEKAGVDEYPAVFSIKMSSSGFGADRYESVCTGFLVHPKLIVTAAHCLQNHSEIEAITNAADANAGGARKFRSAEVGAKPDFVLPSKDRTPEENAVSVANDVGYVVLKEAVADIAPLSVYLTTDAASMNKLALLDATLVGYGAGKWASGGHFENAKVGVKQFGKKPVSRVDFGFVLLDGEKGASLPGDSGGPIFARIDGAMKVIALNQGYAPTKTVVPKMKDGKVKTDRHGKAETKSIVLSEFGTTVGTMMTRKNLCWVAQTSKIDIPGVNCADEPKTGADGKSPTPAK